MKQALPTALLVGAILLPGAALAQINTVPDGPAVNPQSGTAPGARGPQVGRAFTPGWALMGPLERDEHRRQIQSARTLQECRAIVEEHRRKIDERARQFNRQAPRSPRGDACAGLS